MSDKKYIEVVEIATKKTVHKIDVTGQSSRNIEKTVRGILRQTDTDKYYVKDPS